MSGQPLGHDALGIGVVLDDKYEVRQVLGRGGFGEVYKVRHLMLEKEFAMKLLHPCLAAEEQVRERFLREARILLKLDHPNLVKVHDVARLSRITRPSRNQHPNSLTQRDAEGNGEGRLYMTMEFCPWNPLDLVLSRRRQIAAREAARIAIKVLHALEHAHACEVVHRDLKPANLLVSPDADGHWRVKVLDFGIAKIRGGETSEGAAELDLTVPGQVMGSCHYMSPEQVLAQEIDARSDLWSLGVVLYELVTGSRPFLGKNRQEVAAEILKTRPRPWCDLDEIEEGLPGLEALVIRALSKDPGGRPATARAMREELERLEVAATQAPIEAISRARIVSDTATVLAASGSPGHEGLAAPPSTVDAWQTITFVTGLSASASLSIDAMSYQGKNAQGYEEYRHDQTGVIFVLLPAGEFWMGSAETEEGRLTSERRHRVRITRPFLLAKFTVTNAQFRRFRPRHNSGELGSETLNGDEQPVVNIDWDKANAFCSWASPRLRLPTESEWEFAVRGGSDRTFPWGNEWPPPPGAGNFLDQAAKRQFPKVSSIEGCDDGFAVTAPVGRFAVNPFGLYDLGGNVSEWCSDWYCKYGAGDVVDPQGPRTGKHRVVRGGSFMFADRAGLRCAHRCWSMPDARAEDIGLRPAMQAGTR